ncbi:MAG: hypothetical protein ACMG6E_09625, partial [Candidatus Roizmanbacteria bacterium]
MKKSYQNLTLFVQNEMNSITDLLAILLDNTKVTTSHVVTFFLAGFFRQLKPTKRQLKKFAKHEYVEVLSE